MIACHTVDRTLGTCSEGGPYQVKRSTSPTEVQARRSLLDPALRKAGWDVDNPDQVGLSSHRDENLAVKLEVDTNPPAGAVLATMVVRRYVLLQFQHHDRASLLAGKLHALPQRPYVKGGDVYDLLWFLSEPTWPPPNLVMLNSALQQTGWGRAPLTEETWRPAVRARL